MVSADGSAARLLALFLVPRGLKYGGPGQGFLFTPKESDTASLVQLVYCARRALRHSCNRRMPSSIWSTLGWLKQRRAWFPPERSA